MTLSVDLCHRALSIVNSLLINRDLLDNGEVSGRLEIWLPGAANSHQGHMIAPVNASS